MIIDQQAKTFSVNGYWSFCCRPQKRRLLSLRISLESARFNFTPSSSTTLLGVAMRPTEIDPSDYHRLLAQKSSALVASFQRFQPPPLETFASPSLYYRMRAEFRVWHDGDDLYHVMFDPETKKQYRVDQFPPGSRLINTAMATVIPLLKSNQVLRNKLYQIDYLTGLSDELVISFIYRRKLDSDWIDAAKRLLQELRRHFRVDIIGRARKQKIALQRDFIIETVSVDGREFSFKQIENSFTQPNAYINRCMIAWTMQHCAGSDGDLLELYCGAGNFTLPLASRFEKVIATEIAKSSVAAAQFNIARNEIANVDIIQMSSEELSAHIKTGAHAKKMRGIDWQSYDCNTVLVDPPRSGLDLATLELITGFNKIVYISCNPDTLRDNLQQLINTHTIVQFALFDQFPYTHHVEVGVILERK